MKSEANHPAIPNQSREIQVTNIRFCPLTSALYKIVSMIPKKANHMKPSVCSKLVGDETFWTEPIKKIPTNLRISNRECKNST